MSDHYVVIFDGVCNFCSGSVNFIIKRDTTNQFVFAPIQSLAAKRLIAEYDVEDVADDTFVLIKNNRCYLRTDAALEIAKNISGYWYLLQILRVIPRPVRDYFYDIFARNRYRIFGKKDRCIVPDVNMKNKFL